MVCLFTLMANIVLILIIEEETPSLSNLNQRARRTPNFVPLASKNGLSELAQLNSLANDHLALLFRFDLISLPLRFSGEFYE